MADTRERLLAIARDLFNREGVHHVGVRDIARAAGISPGNLSYHFPTKDALLVALVHELHAITARTVFAVLEPTLVGLYRGAALALENALDYRFVLLNPELVVSSSELRQLYTQLWLKRRERLDGALAALSEAGWIDGRAVRARSHWLHEQGQAISSGFLAMAHIQPVRFRSDRAMALHYAKVGMALLEPHCTSKGKRVMHAIFSGKHDD